MGDAYYPIGWSGFSSIPGATTNVGLSAAEVDWKDYKIALACTDQNQAWVNFMSINKSGDITWSGWNQVPSSGKFPGTTVALSAASVGGKLYLYAAGLLDTLIYFNSTSDGKTWDGWQQVYPNGVGLTRIALCAAPGGSLYAVGLKQHLYVNANPTDSKKGSWTEILPDQLTDQGLCVCNYTPPEGKKVLALLCKGLNGQNVWCLYPGLEAWMEVSGTGSTNYAISTAPIFDAGLALFLTGTNSEIYYCGIAYLGGPVDWIKVPGDFQTNVAPAALGIITTTKSGGVESSSEQIYLFAKRTSDGSVNMNIGTVAVASFAGGSDPGSPGRGA
jgi:hypothetical protein